MTDDALLAFRQRCRGYLRLHRIPQAQREDLLSQMVLTALETPRPVYKLAFVYWNAARRLNPRITAPDGTIVTRAALTDPYEAAREPLVHIDYEGMVDLLRGHDTRYCARTGRTRQRCPVCATRKDTPWMRAGKD